MRKSPWHSVKSTVHHVCTNSNTGNNIESENLRSGDGGKPMWEECKHFVRTGSC